MLEIYKFDVFTTPCEIHLYCENKSRADSCASDILKEAKRLEFKYNYYKSNSYLSKLNNRLEKLLDMETKNLLAQAKNYYKKTNGIFDISLATIKDIYKEGSSIKDINEQRENLLPYVGCEHFQVKKNKLYFDNEFTKIDLGGFVKEYSVDRAVSIIKKYGIKSALVNFGGDIYAVGKKPNKQSFSIGIVNPKNKSKTLFSLEIENQALTTSASYERNINIEDQEFSHILSKDDKTKDILSVTIISDTCLKSGVNSTALMSDNTLKVKEKKYIINKNLEVIR